MVKSEGWKRVYEGVWRRTNPEYKYGKLYKFIFICSNNIVRINDGVPKSIPIQELLRDSYIIHKGKTVKQTKNWVLNWMREHSDETLW